MWAARAPGRTQLAGDRRGGVEGLWQAQGALEGMRGRDGGGETSGGEEERPRPARPPSVAGEEEEGPSARTKRLSQQGRLFLVLFSD